MIEEEQLELIITFGHQIESTRRELKENKARRNEIDAQEDLLESRLQSAEDGLKNLLKVIVQSSGSPRRFESTKQ